MVLMTNARITLLLAALLTCSACLTTVFFRPADLFSNTPIYTDDYGMHYSQCIAAKRFLSEFGRCWAYDPYFLAGFPRGVLVNADNKAWELFYSLCSPLVGQGRAFKLYVLLFLVGCPLLIYRAVRNFQCSRAEALTAAWFSLFFLFLSTPKDFIQWGMVSFVIMSYFALYCFSRLHVLFEKFTIKNYLVATAACSLLLLMHILAVLIITVPAVVLYLGRANKFKFREHALVLLLPCVVLGVNGYWLVPIAQMLHYKTARPENYEFVLQIKSAIEALNVYVKQYRSIELCHPVLNNTLPEALLLLLGGGGLYRWGRRRFYPRAFSFGFGAAALFLIAYFGSHTPFFAQFQPQRFTIPLGLLLLVPAACMACRVGEQVLSGRSWRERLFLVALALVVFYRPVVRPFGIFYKNGLYRLNCTFPEELHQLFEFFERETTTDGRILIEDSEFCPEEPEHQYYGGHFTGLFPEYVRREYLAAPRPMYPITHSFASFTRGVLFERDVSSFSLDELQETFDLYNVLWIVCWHDETIRSFARFPGYIRPVAQVEKFIVYRVNREPSFFLKGTGRVRADYNKIELTDLRPEGGEIIIAYHWHETLQAEPPVPIDRVFLGEDPVGFVRIESPPERLQLINSY